MMPPPRSPNPFTSPFGERSGPFFAKRKRNIFKGPALAFGGGSSSGRSASGSGGGSNHGGTSSHSRSASGDRLGRRSGEIAAVQEEDEEEDDRMMAEHHMMMMEEEEEEGLDDDDDRLTVKYRGLQEEDEDEIEEVESFTPVVKGPGEKIEEVILEPGEEVAVENGAAVEAGGSGIAK